MNDFKEVVPVIDYKVSIMHRVGNTDAVLNTPYFSEVNAFFNNTTKKGIPVKQHLTLCGLLERLNNIENKEAKNNSIAILKGLYKGGTSGSYCYKSAPFLFFDIDVKKDKENTHLLDAFENSEVFTKLQDIAVLVWFSNSGNGIAGVLYVPQLAEITHKDSQKHNKIGQAVCDYLKNQLHVNADFDKAQSKFRQIRYLAFQKQKRLLNNTPFEFSYKIDEVYKTTINENKLYAFADFRAPYGSIPQQFNQNVSIHTALTDNGFTPVKQNRYKHFRTTSRDTGEVSHTDNIFFNYSSSFSISKVFTPFTLYLNEAYDNDFKRFLGELEKQGYKELTPTQTHFKEAENKLKDKDKEREQKIFEVCFDLKNATYKDKLSFVNKNASSDTEILFYDYLNIKDLKIKVSETLSVNSYVSEKLNDILCYVDKNNKVILKAETGIGKTTAFIKDFHKYRPNKRLLILAPLTAIVDQIQAENKDIISLTGLSTPEAHLSAKQAPLVIATYEQGFKHLNAPNTFDFVVIDEVHNLITANSFRRQTVKDLTSILSNYKIIGLTATPNLLFQDLGFKILNIEKKEQIKVDVNFIVDNREPLKIALQHVLKVKGKCIMRINSRNVLKSFKEQLIKDKIYKKDEVLILNSDKHIKKGNDFKQLTNESQFNNRIKLVLTTSIIDEGLSIKQSGFTDAVYIETNYYPMPEAVKQFFARFRNLDNKRQNFCYYRATKNQNIVNLNPHKMFKDRLENLNLEAETIDVNDTDKKDIASTKYLYYSDNRVNEFALAYDISSEYFNTMTQAEFYHFLEKNYNIKVNELDTLKEDIDTTPIKANSDKNKKKIALAWLEQNEDIIHALFRLTDNNDIKNSIEFTGYNPPDEILDLVSDNLKAFENLQKYFTKLIELNINNPNTFLIDAKTSKPINLRSLNNDIKHLENLRTIRSPKTKTDNKNRDKLLTFIAEANKLNVINKTTLFQLWNKQRCNSIKPTYDVLKKLINYKE